VASHDCDHVIQKLQRSHKSQVPSLLHARLASPIGCCHGGECNALICPQFGCAQRTLMRDSQRREQRCASHKRCASQRTGPVALLALPFAAAKKLAQNSKEPPSADAGLHNTTAASFGPSQSEHAISFDTSCRHCQSHSKVCDWHADASRRSIVEPSRERITPKISSRTSLQHCIHFSFTPKLAIFICKQLKRPVAFIVVHRGFFKHPHFKKTSLHLHLFSTATP